ncbi:MAG: hypothetical protein ACT4NL_18655 [Pseudomarimonas sp.]
MRAFPPSPAALLGAMTGLWVKSNSKGRSSGNSNNNNSNNSSNNSNSNSNSNNSSGNGNNRRQLSRCALWLLLWFLGSPLWRRRLGDQARHGVRAWMRVRFCQYMDVLSKTPPNRRELAASSRAPHRGRLSFGYFSLAKQRKVTRPPLRWTKPCEEPN